MKSQNDLITSVLSCGARGIRTPEPLLATTRFPGVPLQPLEHRSIKWTVELCGCKVSFFLRIKQALISLSMRNAAVKMPYCAY